MYVYLMTMLEYCILLCLNSQRGLASAYAYQICLNGARFGLYEPFRHTANRLLGRPQNQQSVSVNLASGATSGIIGAVLGNPLFLVKARMQAYSPTNPVGAQHHYKSAFHALERIWKSEGFKGLYRGVDAAMLRTAMGSSVSTSSNNQSRFWLLILFHRFDASHAAAITSVSLC